jgi:hypothetical protein
MWYLWGVMSSIVAGRKAGIGRTIGEWFTVSILEAVLFMCGGKDAHSGAVIA